MRLILNPFIAQHRDSSGTVTDSYYGIWYTPTFMRIPTVTTPAEDGGTWLIFRDDWASSGEFPEEYLNRVSIPQYYDHQSGLALVPELYSRVNSAAAHRPTMPLTT